MTKRNRRITIAFSLLVVLGLAVYYFATHTVAVLQPRGVIAQKERNLMLLAFCLMLIVVLPVFFLTFWIVHKYREDKHADYRPDFSEHLGYELTWWTIPGVLILILSIVTWHSTHALDPYKKIASTQPDLQIEVVSLDWKWLFIYPYQHVAAVNTMPIPVNRPVTLYITSDAPMNSLWIPQLSGQIYAMPGMTTQLNLEANHTGKYYGSSANLSGNGFSDMHFYADAISTSSFNKWANQARATSPNLNIGLYNKLARPSVIKSPLYYSNPTKNLFEHIISEYMPKVFNPNKSKMEM